MQSIYAMHQNGSDIIEKEEKFLLFSIESILDLYLTMLSALLEIRNREIIFLQKSAEKHLATKEERSPNQKFVHNAGMQMTIRSMCRNYIKILTTATLFPTYSEKLF